MRRCAVCSSWSWLLARSCAVAPCGAVGRGGRGGEAGDLCRGRQRPGNAGKGLGLVGAGQPLGTRDPVQQREQPSTPSQPAKPRPPGLAGGKSVRCATGRLLSRGWESPALCGARAWGWPAGGGPGCHPFPGPRKETTARDVQGGAWGPDGSRKRCRAQSLHPDRRWPFPFRGAALPAVQPLLLPAPAPGHQPFPRPGPHRVPPWVGWSAFPPPPPAPFPLPSPRGTVPAAAAAAWRDSPLLSPDAHVGRGLGRWAARAAREPQPTQPSSWLQLWAGLSGG